MLHLLTRKKFPPRTHDVLSLLHQEVPQQSFVLFHLLSLLLLRGESLLRRREFFLADLNLALVDSLFQLLQ